MSLDGHYYSFRTGSETERGPQCVDRFEARVAGNRVTFYRNGRVGCMAPVQSASARPMESFEIRGQELHGPVRGTLSAGGDILCFALSRQSTAAQCAAVLTSLQEHASVYELELPLVPVAVTGMYEVMRKGQPYLNPGHQVTGAELGEKRRALVLNVVEHSFA